MRQSLLYVSILLLLGIILPVRASHQVGGQLEMRAVGNSPGRYVIGVTMYLESGSRADRQDGGRLGIYRKRDNALMTSFTVNETGQRRPIIFSNGFCAEQRNLNFIIATFEADVSLDITLYNDPGGYYISYQTMYRNGGINNIVNPSNTGYTLYLEFPPLQLNGFSFLNSSPRFPTINGEYVCVGEPFTFPFGGTDPDGDELRYSMVTPLNFRGNVSNQNPVSAGPYPDIRWLPGYSATNAMLGSPTLSVNPTTGELSVTATQLGLFVFAVKVEEYRNGVKIGEVRRDFQLLVVECPPATTPIPNVQIKDRPSLRDATLCKGDSAFLQATVNTAWNYQWRRNGLNLPNANGPSLTVGTSGEYTLVVSTKDVCSKVGTSEAVYITVIGTGARLSVTGHLCATTGTVKLKATANSNVTYQWYQDNRLMSGQSTDSLTTVQPGRFYARLTESTLGCKSNTDTFSIERSPAVVARIGSTDGLSRICPQGSLTLTGNGGTWYQWQRDAQPLTDVTTARFDATVAGTYVLTATDADGCVGVSPPFVVTQLAPIIVTMDSLPPVCGADNPVYSLTGSPAGGEFGGSGVSSDTFSPSLAGVGNHVLTYTVKVAPECPGTVARRTAVVAPIPTIRMADSITTFRGNTFTLNPVLTGSPDQFRWASATYLSDPTVASPTVESIREDITYTLSVINSAGCRASDTISIRVLARIWVPDAFSPNGDGQNDNWALPGIEAFPDAIVTIFNRWGEVIFHSEKGYSNPFDGTLNGTALPMGVYAYTLHPAPNYPVQRGRLVLVR